ncbi:MAG: helix-turn-helix domain-containing protein [Spirochaetales bacterium]|nr:helix-turn-helix domain-containing protein [Spirochaetales bacterium]
MFQLNRPDFFDSEELPVKLIRRNPQIPYPLHSHDFSELVIILSGTGIHFTEEGEYRVQAGDVFIIHSGTTHGYKDLEDLNLVNLLFTPDHLPLPFLDIAHCPGYQALFRLEPRYRKSHNFASRLRLGPDELTRVSSLLQRIDQELSEGEKGFAYMASVLFMELIGILSRSYDSSENLESRELLRIARGISFLEHNISGKITLKELEEETGMSASSLNRHFKRVTGVPPLEYHIRLKIRKACTLLKTSDLNITEVAGRCGFEDSNYFTRQFGKVMCMTPRQYRKSE